MEFIDDKYANKYSIGLDEFVCIGNSFVDRTKKLSQKVGVN